MLRELFPWRTISVVFMYFVKQLRAILYFHMESVSDLSCGGLNKLQGDSIYAKVKILVMQQRLEAKLAKLQAVADRLVGIGKYLTSFFYDNCLD